MGCRTVPAMLEYAGEGAWWARASDVGGAVELHRRCLGKSYNMGKMGSASREELHLRRESSRGRHGGSFLHLWEFHCSKHIDNCWYWLCNETMIAEAALRFAFSRSFVLVAYVVFEI